MKTLERVESAQPKAMAYFVRPMRLGDIPQVAEIERECFPTGWSPTPFQRELQRGNAGYLVACQAADPLRAQEEAREPDLGQPLLPRRPAFRRLMEGVKGLFSPEAEPTHPETPQYIAGYLGLWFITDEAHITAIGVREAGRRRGIGELLLLASIELGVRRGARVETLETRVSNYPAQALYLKYGFNRAGIRRGYYNDNREDALIMTTDPLLSPAHQERQERLARAHALRWGESVRWLG